MGYCYEGRKLVCDLCSHAGARKRRCPFGYCSPTVACESCWQEHRAGWRERHREAGCEEGHRRYEAGRAEETRLLAAGRWLRCSAQNVWEGPDKGLVQVTFRNGAGECRAQLMEKAVYDAYPLLRPTTEEDYDGAAERLGLARPKPAEGARPTKRVTLAEVLGGAG